MSGRDNMSNIHLYNIGYGSYENSEYAQFIFDKKLSKKELWDYVSKATINALKYALKHENEFFWGFKEEGIKFEDIFPRVIVELGNQGFKKVEYDGEWSCFGWASVCSRNSWGRGRNLENMILHNSIPMTLKEKVLRKARKMERNMKKPGKRIKRNQVYDVLQ